MCIFHPHWVTNCHPELVTSEEKANPAISTQMAEYTTSMESFIDNFLQSTQDNYKNCDDDPYLNIFE